MTQQDLSVIEQLMEQLKAYQKAHENAVQQGSASNSTLLKMIQELTKNMEENTKLTKEIASHEIFEAYRQGKFLGRFVKWVGVVIIGFVALLTAIKTGGSIIKEFLHL